MSVEQHPDYEVEKEWLEFAKKYIDIVIKASESTEETFRENLRSSLEGMDFKDSSFSYMSMLTNSNLLRRTADEVRKLKKIEQKPYFARINFKREGKDGEEVLYFGKASLFDKETQQPIIVDWRSPVANLYYDGRLGEVSYDAEGEEYHGYLSLKRQLIIEEGQLEEIRDIDLTTVDELLQKSLSESSSNRLTEIVATIQEEQNNIIRADLNKPIIVQGAAGSGKTTIALHRISYFIYTYQDYFSPEQLMILAPNNLFLDYISEVLPELGVERVNQTTFVDFVRASIGKKIKLKHPDEKLIGFISNEFEQPELVRWLSAFKGSLQFRDIIDQYLEEILITLIPTEDLYISKFCLYKASRIRELMTHEYRYLPFYGRKEKVKKVLQNHVRLEKKRLFEKVTKFYDNKLDAVLFRKNVEPEKRKSYVTRALDKKSSMLEELARESKTAVSTYMKKLPKYDLFYYYQNLVTNNELFSRYAKGVIPQDKIDYFCHYHEQQYKKKVYEVEDLAALLYLQSQLFGIKKESKVKNVVIDEAQDYSYFQLYALKAALETDMFTIVGDLAQGIHSYRGINDWETVQEEIFPRSTYKTLQKSYRTTVEVMNVANEILKRLNRKLPLVEPVVRHGEIPRFFYASSDEREMIKLLDENINQLYSEGVKTIAVIGKTNTECMKISKLFSKYSNLKVQLLQESEQMNSDNVVVVSAHLSKGLEFDAVLMCCFDESYLETEIDIRLLYVSMTRPLHRLHFYGGKIEDFLLHHVNSNLITIAN